MFEQVAVIESTVERTEAAETAFEVLVRLHTRLVFQIAYSVLRNHHDAEDATQETFLRIIRYRRELSGVEDQKAWVARIAWRVSVGRRIAPTPDDPASDATLAQLRSQCAGAEQIAIDTQMLRLAENLIAHLPADLRDPLTLSTVDQMTSAEIGLVLGIPESSVRTRLHRARRLLKEKLASLLEGKTL